MLHKKQVLAVIILVLFPICAGQEPMEPVQIIGTGKAAGMPHVKNWILIEPSIDGLIVPTRASGDVTPSDVRRLMRVYFPRTFDSLLTFDFLFLAQVDMKFISDQKAEWMYEAMEEHGLGGVNTRSVMSMQPWWSGPWADSILSEAFPNDAYAVTRCDVYGKQAFWPSGPLVVEDDQSLPPVAWPFEEQLEKLFPSYGGLPTIPKPGSKVHTWIRSGLKEIGSPRPGFTPHIFEWEYGEAITFTFMDMVYDDFWRTNENPFAIDIITNVIWRGDHRKLPDDGMKVHVLRDRLVYYQQEKSAVISVFDFAEKFGANTADIYEKLEELDDEKDLADDLYMRTEFDQAYSQMESVIQQLNMLAEDAMKLKDQALLWVYVAEWLAVAATSLITGGVIWALMIRRKLYREAGVTRSESQRTDY